MKIEGGSIRSHGLEKWLWKRLWRCRKADFRMNESSWKELKWVKQRVLRTIGHEEVNTGWRKSALLPVSLFVIG